MEVNSPEPVLNRRMTPLNLSFLSPPAAPLLEMGVVLLLIEEVAESLVSAVKLRRLRLDTSMESVS